MALWLGLPNPSTSSPPSLKEVASLMRPFEETLEIYPCPREVGRVGNDNPNFILPVNQRKDGIMAAFGRAKGGKGESTEKGKGREKEKTEEELKTNEVEGESSLKGKDIKDKSEEPRGKEVEVEEQVLLSEVANEMQTDLEEKSDPSLEIESPASKSNPIFPSITSNSIEPSSKFSPEPWNPPIPSPSPPKASKSTPSKATSQSKANEKAAIGTSNIEDMFKKQEKRKREEEEFMREAGMREGSRDEDIDEKGGEKGGREGKASGKQTEKSGNAKKQKKEKEDGGSKSNSSPKKGGNKDIRSFFK